MRSSALGRFKAASATRANAMFDRIFRQVLDDMTGAAAGNLSLPVFPGLPEPGDVP